MSTELLLYRQEKRNTCALACLRMILAVAYRRSSGKCNTPRPISHAFAVAPGEAAPVRRGRGLFRPTG
jgi:hypothetical protein